jgi:phage terminase small subunit
LNSKRGCNVKDKGIGRPPKHGAYAGRELIPLTSEKTAFVLRLLEGQAVMIGPADEVAVELLARNLAKIELIDRYLQVHGLFSDKEGTPQPVLRIYWQAMNAAMRQCDALGLTPSARVRLGLSLASAKHDLAARMQVDREQEDAKRRIAGELAEPSVPEKQSETG